MAPLSILRRPAPLLVVGLLATVLVGTAWTGAPPAGAAPTILVTSNVDDADLAPGDGVCASAFNGCTLRAAIQEAVASPGTVVQLNPGRYAVDDQLSIPAGQVVTIAGAGSGRTLISGQRKTRVFDIAATARVTIDGVTIRDGKVSKPGASQHYHGAGIHNHGTLLLTNSALVGNVSDFVSWEPLPDGRNVPHFWGGGGITNASTGDATLVNVTLWANTARSDDGAGIENWGRMRLENVTVGLQWASSWQAAVNNKPGANLHVTASIFQHIGGVCSTSGTPCTGAKNCSGTIVADFSISDDQSCVWGIPYDGIDAKLGLYDTANDVLPLTAASPALEFGIPTQAGVRDQLGKPRPADSDCNGSAVEDLGAVEYQPTFTFGGRVWDGCPVRGIVAGPPVLRPVP